MLDRGWTFPVKEVEIERIEELMNDCLDLFFPVRCRADNYLYIIWDIEYFNKEKPAFIFDRTNQKKVFDWMTPALEIVEQILESFNIKYLVDVTISGVHIWSKIRTDSDTFYKLAQEGTVLPSLAEKYAKIIPDDRKRVSPVSANLGRAYNTAGKILEYFTHLLIQKNKKRNPTKIPVTISDSPQLNKRFPYSGISSDLTQYAHPIYMRCIRALCSTHQKSLMNGYNELGPAIDIIKIKGMSYSDILATMWDVNKAIDFYKKIKPQKVETPEASSGWLNAFNSYRKSELRKIHKKWEKMDNLSGTIDINQPEIKKFFENPNPALLIPGNLQTIANHLAKGEKGGEWHKEKTKKMFNLIAKYYNNKSFGWYNPVHFTGINWDKYDAETATDFWGRVYWSLT